MANINIQARGKNTSNFYHMLTDSTGLASIHDIPNKAETLRPQGQIFKSKTTQSLNPISIQKPNHKVRNDTLTVNQPKIVFKSHDNFIEGNNMQQFTLADDKDVKIPLGLRNKNYTSFFNETDPEIFKKEYEKIMYKYRSKREKLPHLIDELNNDTEFLPPNDYDIFTDKLNI
jgi:hypothetical protein